MMMSSINSDTPMLAASNRSSTTAGTGSTKSTMVPKSANTKRRSPFFSASITALGLRAEADMGYWAASRRARSWWK